MQLLGLFWAGTEPSVLKPFAKKVLATQTAEGAWRQHDGLAPDAYATGELLYALVETGTLSPTDRRWKRASRYLLDTQHEDGSWYVASHSAKIQANFEGGFPYHGDQWISNWGTSWAAMALMAGIDSPQSAHR